MICRTAIACLVALASLALLGGCYEHVVSAKGPGARKVQVYEPNLKEDEHLPIIDDLDDASSPEPEFGRRRRTSPGGR